MALNVLWHCYIANVLMRWTVHKVHTPGRQGLAWWGVLMVLCVQESVARLVKGMNLWMLALMGSLLLFLMMMIDTLVYRVRHTHMHTHARHALLSSGQPAERVCCGVVVWWLGGAGPGAVGAGVGGTGAQRDLLPGGVLLHALGTTQDRQGTQG